MYPSVQPQRYEQACLFQYSSSSNLNPVLTLTLAAQQDVNGNEVAKSIVNDKIETSEVWWLHCRGL